MVEERLSEWITHVVKETGCSRVCYGGGVAMNVKANMHLGQIEGVDELFVPLSPGDESNTMGAAYFLTEEHYRATKRDPNSIPPLDHAYLGQQCDAQSVAEALVQASQEGFSVREIASADEVASLLAAGKVIARCSGAGEFGQRALGDRSILANPGEPGVIEKLIRRLNIEIFGCPLRHQSWIDDNMII